MPKIFEYLNYIIRFYTNDHLPIHVHVQVQQREIKVEFHIMGGDVTLIFKSVGKKEPLTQSEAQEVGEFLKRYYIEIITKWQTVFILNQSVECEVVRKKLKRKK